MASTPPYQPFSTPVVTEGNRIMTDPWQGWVRVITAQAAAAGSVTAVTATAPISSSGGTAPNISHDASGVVAGTYGDSTHVAQVTLNATGHVTTATAVAIAATGTVTHTAGNLTLNELVLGNGGADIKTVAATDGQIPIGKTSDGTVTLATLTAGSGISITNAAAAITIAATSSGGSSTLIGLDRLVADGSMTAFDLADLAEYVVSVSDAGVVVDPATYALSADQAQVTFDAAPTAGDVLTFEYVVAQA